MSKAFENVIKLNDIVSVRDFGAKGDSIADDTAAINAAAAAVQSAGGGDLHIPPGQYLISATIVIPTLVSLKADNSAVFFTSTAFTGTAVRITGAVSSGGGVTATAIGRFHVLPTVRKGSTGGAPVWSSGSDTTSIGVEMYEVNLDTFYIPAIQNFYEGLVLRPAAGNVFYNTFNLGRIINNYRGISFYSTATPTGSNQNTFIGGTIRIDGVYTSVANTTHLYMPGAETNGNTFVGVNLEGTGAGGPPDRIIFCQSQNNVWLNARFEGAKANSIVLQGINNRIVAGNPASISTGYYDNIVDDTGFANVYDWSNIIGGRYIEIDFNSVLEPLKFGVGGGVSALPLGAYDADEFKLGDANTVGTRYYGALKQIPAVVTSGSNLASAPKGNIQYLNYSAPESIVNSQSWANDLATFYTLFDQNGNITIANTSTVSTGQGRFVNRSGQNRVMRPQDAALYVSYDGNFYEVGPGPIATATAAEIASVSNAINTTRKYIDKRVWDTTNNRELRARGVNANSPWDVVDGSTSVTPS